MVFYVLIINLVGFDIAWFGLIYWGNFFVPIAVLMLCLHFYFISLSKTSEFCFICIISFIGILTDLTLQFLGIFIFPSGELMPYWLITLWFCFASTICHSLKFLQNSALLQVLMGALIAPFSYLAASKLQAVSFGLPLVNTLVILSLIWGLLMVTFFSLKSCLIKEEIYYV